jgi:hypothetical protein
LKDFPIAKPDKKNKELLVRLVDEILKRKNINSAFDCVELEKEIDKIVYLLTV